MLKRLLKLGGWSLATVVVVATALALYVDLDGIPRYAKPVIEERAAVATPERLARGAKLASLLCAGCHEDASTHRFTGKAMDDMPEQFGTVVSKNITAHPVRGIGGWTDGQLRHFLRTGVKPDGQYVPPWMIKMPHASEEDIDAILVFLRSNDPRVAPSDVVPPGVSKPSLLAKALAHGVFEPLPYPKTPIAAPPKTDTITFGRYLVFTLDCFGCHSGDFKKVNALEPEKSYGYMGGGEVMKGASGKAIHTANLTADTETGIGAWTESQFVRAVRQGFRPDGRVLQYPMEPRPELDDEEAAAIYAYLRSIPKIRNQVPRPVVPELVAAELPGKALYQRYGCAGCHGDTGKGAVGDLRRANANYPSDAALRRWIDEAPSIKPSTKMPGWKGVIKEEDYPALLAYVRALSASGSLALNEK